MPWVFAVYYRLENQKHYIFRTTHRFFLSCVNGLHYKYHPVEHDLKSKLKTMACFLLKKYNMQYFDFEVNLLILFKNKKSIT